MDKRNDERGVSDVLGFVLIFGLILTSVTIVYATGFESLTNSQEKEELRNVERAYDILADNIESVTRGDAPVRSTQLRLGSSEMTSGDEVTFELIVYDENGDRVDDNPPQMTVTPIEYRTTGGSSIRYENGAVIRSVQSGETLISNPPIQYADEKLLVPFIHTRPADGVVGVSGGTVDVRTSSSGSETLSYHPNPDQSDGYGVSLRIEAERTDVWERYCTNTEFLTVNDEETTSGEQVVCDGDEDAMFEAIYVQYNSIDVRYDT